MERRLVCLEMTTGQQKTCALATEWHTSRNWQCVIVGRLINKVVNLKAPRECFQYQRWQKVHLLWDWGGGGHQWWYVRKHAHARGVWWHAPPSEKCLKLGALRSLLRPYLYSSQYCTSTLSHTVTADWLSHFYMLCGSNIMHIHCTQMCTFNNSTIVLFMQSNVWNCCLLDEHMWFLSSNIEDTHTVVQKLGFNFCKLMCTHTLCVETALQSVCCLLLQVKVTPKHSEECKRLLTLMGVPYIDVSAGLDTSTRIIPVQ